MAALPGFPDMYLDLHVNAFNELIEFKKRKVTWDATNETYNFLETVESIINHDFVEEFIILEYEYLMLIPEDIQLEIEKYKQWSVENVKNIGLDKTRYYLIYFGANK